MLRGPHVPLGNQEATMTALKAEKQIRTLPKAESGCFCLTNGCTIKALGHVAYLATSPQVEDRTTFG